MSARSIAPWDEIGDRVFRRHYESLSLNAGLIIGEQHVVVVDSRATHRQADELLDDIRTITPRPVTILVNTHHHWDHTFGNARFDHAEIVGHERCRAVLIDRGEEMRAELVAAEWMPDEGRRQMAEVVITPPGLVFREMLSLDVGGRSVELRYLGRGHTDNDIVISIDDVVFAGDLVEESAPPAFGDAYPSEWVATLDAISPMLAGPVVPGHGAVVDRAFVEAQRDEISRAIRGDTVFPDQTMAELRSRLDADA